MNTTGCQRGGERRVKSCASLKLHIAWLQKSSVERSGAAQGLAEVLAVLGRDHVEALLPDVLAACTSPSPFVREGNLTLFRFLPHAIPDQFQVRPQAFSQPGGNLYTIAACSKYNSADTSRSRKGGRSAEDHLSYKGEKNLLDSFGTICRSTSTRSCQGSWTAWRTSQRVCVKQLCPLGALQSSSLQRRHCHCYYRLWRLASSMTTGASASLLWSCWATCCSRLVCITIMYNL